MPLDPATLPKRFHYEWKAISRDLAGTPVGYTTPAPVRLRYVGFPTEWHAREALELALKANELVASDHADLVLMESKYGPVADPFVEPK